MPSVPCMQRKASHVPAVSWIKKRNHVIVNVCESCLERVFPVEKKGI